MDTTAIAGLSTDKKVNFGKRYNLQTCLDNHDDDVDVNYVDDDDVDDVDDCPHTCSSLIHPLSAHQTQADQQQRIDWQVSPKNSL